MRAGFGRVKLSSTVFLRVHGHITSGRIHLGWIHMSGNPPDSLTKPISGPSIYDALDSMGVGVMSS